MLVDSTMQHHHLRCFHQLPNYETVHHQQLLECISPAAQHLRAGQQVRWSKLQLLRIKHLVVFGFWAQHLVSKLAGQGTKVVYLFVDTTLEICVAICYQCHNTILVVHHHDQPTCGGVEISLKYP